ncbi:Serine/threonine-protein kinase StkP [Nonomuraea coxensis DSM 45129]|uniref:non-specific serine/threonine protein kinase n=1 Tax=Nonomuraea coxensis DSM 45129 TaxID=1122611 RepID=A0ABX8TYY6_9ACTN|nr:serine/threonine-protein kinase [Nonomuraea coxensis]QYC40705.1 Serine/threonine-protein kinase StkP [Nonomuraea coxensis DSM 45129]
MLVANRYRLLEPLGEGGMGVVWRAYDELLDRTVAVKEVRYAGVGDERRAELNRRTIREARAAGRLDHPSVVVVHDVVEEDGRPWIVMQLVRSRSLAQVVREQGPLPVGQVAVIGGRVLDALRAAHATGVLHRDVKPENVLLADDGRVVLTDFGIASLEAEAGLTATGGLVGTPAYMPPERLNGEPARPESDLWSLGATLYAAVEGEPPFKRDSWAATVAAVLRDQPEPPRRAGALTPVVMGLLHRDPAGRLPAGEAARLLHELATTHPLPAAPSPGPTPPSPSQFPGPSGQFPGPSGQPFGQSPDQFSGSSGGPYSTRAPGPAHVTVPEQRRRRGWAPLAGVAAVVAALAVLGGVGAGGWLLYDRSASPQTSSPATDPAADPATSGPTATEPTTTDPAATGPAEPTPSATPSSAPTTRPLPAGWRTLTSAAGGFTIGLPKGWRATKNPTRDSIRLTGPGTPGAMIVEWTVPDIPWRDPKSHWLGLEREIRAKGEFSDYTRIGITGVRYLGREAADWEFTRTRSGSLIHVVNRGFHTADGRPFALYWETLDSRWARDRHYFDAFVRTFRPR